MPQTEPVTLPRHRYERDKCSGAGNCWCGWSRESIVHLHAFTPAYVDPMRCVCGKPPNHSVHGDPDAFIDAGIDSLGPEDTDGA